MKLLNKGYKFFWNNLVASNDGKRMAKQTLPGDITAIVDIPYLNDGKQAHLMDIYFPSDKHEAKLPVVIDIHGGGLMYAYKELNKNYCYHIAKRGFTVINVSYSLCPDDPFPMCLTDVMSALKYIGENLDAYPCDRNKVFITGDSAGALLAAYAVLLNTGDELAAFYKTDKSNLDIKAIGLTSGMFFYDQGLAKFLSPGIFGCSRKKSPYKDHIAFYDIIDKGTFPPSYLVTSDEDMIQKSTLLFEELLTDRKIEHVIDNFPKVEGRKLEHVFSVLYPSEYPESVQTIDNMTKFFLEHC